MIWCPTILRRLRRGASMAGPMPTLDPTKTLDGKARSLISSRRRSLLTYSWVPMWPCWIRFSTQENSFRRNTKEALSWRSMARGTDRAGWDIRWPSSRSVSGKPQSGPKDFLTGFMLAPEKREVWGRPVGLFQLPDGSLLMSDDGGNKIWRISYKS